MEVTQYSVEHWALPPTTWDI